MGLVSCTEFTRIAMLLQSSIKKKEVNKIPEENQTNWRLGVEYSHILRNKYCKTQMVSLRLRLWKPHNCIP